MYTDYGKETIRFRTLENFLFFFIRFLENNIEEYDRKYIYLTSEYSDDHSVESAYKDIDCFRIQHRELLKVMKEYSHKIKNS